MTANLMTNDPEIAVWMNPNTFNRFWKESNKSVFEADDGMKFRTYEAAEAHAAK